MVDHFNAKVLEGLGAQQGNAIIAVIEDAEPRFRKGGPWGLMWARKAIKGLVKLAPGHSRLPFPWS